MGGSIPMTLGREYLLRGRYWLVPLLGLQIACGLLGASTTWMVVLAPLVLVLAVVSILWLQAGIFILAAALFLHFDIPGLIGVYPADLLSILLLAGLLVHGLWNQRVPKTFPVLPMVAVLTVFSLSLVGAHNPNIGLRNLLRHVQMFGVILLAAAVLDRNDVRRLLRVLLFMSLVLALPNIIEAIRIGGRQRVFGAAGLDFPFFLAAAIKSRCAISL